MADRPRRLTSFGDYCRSNGPRVGQPEPQNLSRHRGRLRPSRPQGEEPPSKESTARRPTAHSRPSPRDDFGVSRLLTGDFQRSRLWGVGLRLQQTPCPHREGHDQGVATVKPAPAPYQGQAWPQHAVPREIYVRRGTVAVPALTSAPKDRVQHPRRLVCTTLGGGSHQSVGP